ncbi:MAG: NUDIX hydrolase [Clostridia bacterium]|nr:NUDIX hydrolase [Clostridia bacterium]
MKLEEKTLNSTLIHKGRITEYYDDVVLLPDGKTANREYVSHRGGAAILALDEEDNVYLVRQFRYPYREEILEIPAGKLEKGEIPVECAKRELTEETGRECKEIIEYGVFYPTPGYSNEKLYIFRAIVGKDVGMRLDDTEFIDLVKTPLKNAYEMVLNGEIRDGKTAYAIMRYYAEKLDEKYKKR